MDAATAIELLDAQPRVWDHCSSYVISMVVQCAVEMEIPDVIQNHGRPISLPELAGALKISPAKAPSLSRLMRMLVHLNYFIHIKSPKSEEEEAEGEGRYRLAPLSQLLLKNNPFSAGPLIISMNHAHVVNPWRQLSAWFRTTDDDQDRPPPPPLAFAHGGKNLYDVCSADPPFGQMFARAMGADSWLFSRVLVGKCRKEFEGLSSLVDVGGSTGTTAKVIAEAFPGIRCTVFDLPRVVAAEARETHPNLDYVGGDMFADDIPPADAVLFKWVLLDWSDERCLKVLKKCKEALLRKNGGKGKVMIADHVLGHESCNDRSSVGTSLLIDLTDMVCFEGCVRTENQWAKLFSDSGFSSYTITPVAGLRVLIQVYP